MNDQIPGAALSDENLPPAVDESTPEGPQPDPNHQEKEAFFSVVGECRRIILVDLIPAIENRFGYGHEEIDDSHVEDARRLLAALKGAHAVTDGWLDRHLARLES